MIHKQRQFGWTMLLVVLLATHWLPAAADPSGVVKVGGQTEPQMVLTRYLEALYSQDFARIYELISTQDKRWKSKEDYLRENTSFVGSALALARKLATFIEYQDVVTDVQGDRATVMLTFRLPNANDPALRQLLLDFDPDRLTRLSAAELDDLEARLSAMHRAGQLPMIEGEAQWELLKEPQGWRVFLNWAGAIRVRFGAEVKDDLPWKFWPVQQVVLVQPGETLQAVYRVKNLSDQPVTAKAVHIDKPKDLADKYLEIIQCFCFIQITLEAGEEKELPLLFRVRWDAPETVKTFSVRYVFYPIESFPGKGLDREAQQLAVLALGQLEVRLTDHREAIADFSRLELSVSQINIQRGSRPKAGAWMGFAPSKQKVDLTQLVEGRYAIILKEKAPAGEYRWIKLNLEEVKGIRKDGRQPNIEVRDDPVALHFRITRGKTTMVTVDLIVLDMSDHPGQDYELHIRKVSAQVVEATES